MYIDEYDRTVTFWHPSPFEYALAKRFLSHTGMALCRRVSGCRAKHRVLNGFVFIALVPPADALFRFQTMVLSVLLLLLLFVQVATSSQHCSTAADCNYGGVCDRGRCNCLPTWIGDTCGQLNLLEASPYAKYPSNGGMPDQDVWTWGGTAMLGDEDGKVHLFVTEWMNHCPMTYPSFLTQTHIVHVVCSMYLRFPNASIFILGPRSS